MINYNINSISVDFYSPAIPGDKVNLYQGVELKLAHLFIRVEPFFCIIFRIEFRTFGSALWIIEGGFGKVKGFVVDVFRVLWVNEIPDTVFLSKELEFF